MATPHPLTGSPAALHRLARLYVGAFFALTLAFYTSQPWHDAQPNLVLLAIITAGIALLLLRLDHRLDDAAPTLKVRSNVRFQEGQLLRELDRLLKKRPSARHAAGLLLVVVNGVDGEEKALPKALLHLIKDQTEDQHGVHTFQIDSKTVAVTASREHLVDDLERLAMGIQGSFRFHRTDERELRPLRLTIGVAVTERTNLSAADLLKRAWTSVTLAESRGRDVYSRVI